MPGETAQRFRSNSNPFGAAGDCPVGSIVAWPGSFSRIPALPGSWVQCNGQVVTDTSSPFFGLTLPNLNSPGSFLYGGSTSGGTGGSSTVTVTMNIAIPSSSITYVSTVVGGTTGTANMLPSSATTTTASATATSLPPYYKVIWIMRIK